MECVSALHHNKRKTNYHIHLIFSERELLPEPIEKIATRNMFYNEQKKHVRTKKEILDDSGNVRKGCKIIKKGEVYERTLFTAKNKLFKQEHYLDEAKHFYTDLINLLRVILSTLSATFNTAFRFPALKKSRDFLSALRGSAFVNYFLDPTITATHKNAVTHTIVVQIIAIIFLFSFPRSLFCRLFL